MCIYDPNIGEILIMSVKYFWTNFATFVPLFVMFSIALESYHDNNLLISHGKMRIEIWRRIALQEFVYQISVPHA